MGPLPATGRRFCIRLQRPLVLSRSPTSLPQKRDSCGTSSSQQHSPSRLASRNDPDAPRSRSMSRLAPNPAPRRIRDHPHRRDHPRRSPDLSRTSLHRAPRHERASPSTFSYDKDNRTVIDLGLRDPQGQRGWSGGNKDTSTVGDISDATPSYRPGAIQPGEWKLILGIPNVRDGQTSRLRRQR
jgi:hypothetical protein